MKTLIVFNHPFEESFCGAVLQAVQNGLKESRKKFDVIHLDRDRFDPMMREKDLLAFRGAGKGDADALEVVDPEVLEYKAKLEEADHLVIIFPIWWMTMPAMTKGFIDKVIFPAIAYNNAGGGRMKSRLPLEKVTVISTMNTPADIYRDMFHNALEGALIKGTFKQIGIEDVEWISLSEVKQAGDEQRRKWLRDIETRFGSIPDMVA